MPLKSDIIKVLSELTSLWEVPSYVFDKLRSSSVASEFHRIAMGIVDKYRSLYNLLFRESNKLLNNILVTYEVVDPSNSFQESRLSDDRSLLIRHSILESYLNYEIPRVQVHCLS